MKYLIFYDIRDGKRLHEAAKLLGRNGKRVQKSFFSCSITDMNVLAGLKEQLGKIIDKKEDKVAIYPVCDKCLSGGYYIGSTPFDFFDTGYVIL